MTEQVSTSYCEVCGIDVKTDTDLKRFGKLFCSKEHMDQYVRARQKSLGLVGEEGAQEGRGHERRRSLFRGC